MRRAILLLSILLPLPQAMRAQEAPSGSRTHTVVTGETLSGIAQRYLGSAGAWQQILEVNRDRISNPNVIIPGMVLTIPGGGGTANVIGFQAGGVTFAQDDLGSYEVRRAMREYRPFGTSEVAEVPIDQRTVFYEENAVAAAVVVVPTREEVAAVPESLFHTASWLIPEGKPLERIGDVVARASDISRPASAAYLLQGDAVRLRLEGTAPQVGDEYIVYGIRRVIRDVGSVAVPAGRLQVTSVNGGEATARVIAQYDRIQIGDPLTRALPFTLRVGVHPVEVDSEYEARIVAFAEDQELYLPGDQAFIDRGGDAGIVVGDELVTTMRGAAEGEIVRFQVVGVRPDGATVRITSVGAALPLRPGLPLTIDRKMP